MAIRKPLFTISLEHVRVNYNFIHILKTDQLPWSPPHSGNIQQAIRLARNACRELDIKLAMTGNTAVGGTTYNQYITETSPPQRRAFTANSEGNSFQADSIQSIKQYSSILAP